MGPGPALVVGALIAYGSLFPFEFAAPGEGALWRALLASAAGDDLRLADLAINTLAFLGWGGLVAASRPPGGAAVAMAAGASLALGLALQCGQVFLPERIPSPWDIAYNTAGGLLGGWLVCSRTFQRAWPGGIGRIWATGLIALWVAATLLALTAEPEWRALIRLDAPSLADAGRDAVAILGTGMGWAAVARLWVPAFGPRLAHAGPWGMLATVLLIQALVRDAVPATGAIAGSAAGLALGRALPRAPGVGDAMLLGGLVAYLVASGLAPFVPRPAAEFEWWPLSGFLWGDPAHVLAVAVEKAFWYALLVELLRRTVPGPLRGPMLGATLLAAIEIGQLRIGSGHVPESTDPLLFLVLSYIRVHLSNGSAGCARDRPAWSSRCPG